MAVQNSLKKQAQSPMERKAEFDVNGKHIALSPNDIKRYLSTGSITDEEAIVFLNLCKNAGLNPWLREAYCIKYGTEPATMVTGKEAFLKRAESNPDYDGFEAGVILETEDGEMTYREGSFARKSEKIVGGWAAVYRKDKGHPYRAEVSFDEYAVRKRDGSMNQQWSKRPATMIRKVALVQALREAFTKSFGGMYTAEELGVQEMEGMPVEQPVEKTAEPVEVVEPEPADMPVTEDDLPFDESLL